MLMLMAHIRDGRPLPYHQLSPQAGRYLRRLVLQQRHGLRLEEALAAERAERAPRQRAAAELSAGRRWKLAARAVTARPADTGQLAENARMERMERMENRALAAKLQAVAYRDASSGIPGTREWTFKESSSQGLPTRRQRPMKKVRRASPRARKAAACGETAGGERRSPGLAAWD
jgi:hypothetical protein